MAKSRILQKTISSVVASIIIAAAFTYTYLSGGLDVSAIIPRGCKVCDAYGSCVQNSSASCDPQSNECAVNNDCTQGGNPPPPPGYDYPSCTECDPAINLCIQLPPPCSGYTCTPNSKCSGVPQSPSGDCPINNGFPWCKQTNPSYGQWVLDGCGQKVYQYTCGHNVVSSVLCKYKGECNVMENIANYMSNIKCKRNGNSDLFTILDRSVFDGGYELYYATPDNGKFFSRDKLIALVRAGNALVVSGLFKAEGGNSIAHHSLIVGVTAEGKLIYNDPYFNCDNSNETDRVCTDTIEDEMDSINITNAFIVKPED